MGFEVVELGQQLELVLPLPPDEIGRCALLDDPVHEHLQEQLVLQHDGVCHGLTEPLRQRVVAGGGQ